MSHDAERRHLHEIATVIAASAIPTVCLMGNHDAFSFTAEEFYAILGECVSNHQTYDGKRLIFLDACYFRTGAHYAPGDSDWTDTYLPHLSEPADLPEDTAYENILFLHQNIDPTVPPRSSGGQCR